MLQKYRLQFTFRLKDSLVATIMHPDFYTDSPKKILSMIPEQSNYLVLPSFLPCYSKDFLITNSLSPEWLLLQQFLSFPKKYFYITSNLFLDLFLPLTFEGKVFQARALLHRNKILGIRVNTSGKHKWKRRMVVQYNLPDPISKLQKSCPLGQFYYSFSNLSICQIFRSQIPMNKNIIDQYQKIGCQIISITDSSQSKNMFQEMYGGIIIWANCRGIGENNTIYSGNGYITYAKQIKQCLMPYSLQCTSLSYKIDITSYKQNHKKQTHCPIKVQIDLFILSTDNSLQNQPFQLVDIPECGQFQMYQYWLLQILQRGKRNFLVVLSYSPRILVLMWTLVQLKPYLQTLPIVINPGLPEYSFFKLLYEKFPYKNIPIQKQYKLDIILNKIWEEYNYEGCERCVFMENRKLIWGWAVLQPLDQFNIIQFFLNKFSHQQLQLLNAHRKNQTKNKPKKQLSDISFNQAVIRSIIREGYGILGLVINYKKQTNQQIDQNNIKSLLMQIVTYYPELSKEIGLFLREMKRNWLLIEKEVVQDRIEKKLMQTKIQKDKKMYKCHKCKVRFDRQNGVKCQCKNFICYVCLVEEYQYPKNTILDSNRIQNCPVCLKNCPYLWQPSFISCKKPNQILPSQKLVQKRLKFHCHLCTEPSPIVYTCDDPKCGIIFCRRCILNDFEQSFSKPINWKCFSCQGVCICQKCIRKQQLKKMIEGPRFSLKSKETNLNNEFDYPLLKHKRQSDELNSFFQVKQKDIIPANFQIDINQKKELYKQTLAQPAKKKLDQKKFSQRTRTAENQEKKFSYKQVENENVPQLQLKRPNQNEKGSSQCQKETIKKLMFNRYNKSNLNENQPQKSIDTRNSQQLSKNNDEQKKNQSEFVNKKSVFNNNYNNPRNNHFQKDNKQKFYNNSKTSNEFPNATQNLNQNYNKNNKKFNKNSNQYQRSNRLNQEIRNNSQSFDRRSQSNHCQKKILFNNDMENSDKSTIEPNQNNKKLNFNRFNKSNQNKVSQKEQNFGKQNPIFTPFKKIIQNQKKANLNNSQKIQFKQQYQRNYPRNQGANINYSQKTQFKQQYQRNYPRNQGANLNYSQKTQFKQQYQRNYPRNQGFNNKFAKLKNNNNNQIYNNFNRGHSSSIQKYNVKNELGKKSKNQIIQY